VGENEKNSENISEKSTIAFLPEYTMVLVFENSKYTLT